MMLLEILCWPIGALAALGYALMMNDALGPSPRNLDLYGDNPAEGRKRDRASEPLRGSVRSNSGGHQP